MTYDNHRSGSRRLVAVVATLLLLAAGCGKDLTLAEWEAGWREVNATLPALEQLGGDPSELCSETLGSLRALASEYRAAPNGDLRLAFDQWLEYAESVFFDCPPPHDEGRGFETAYEELHRLGSEVDALIAYEHEIQGS